MTKSIAKIKQEFEQAGKEQLLELIAQYETDPRAGVANLIRICRRKEEALEEERQRLDRMKVFEREYEHLGYVCGIDEAGRGPLAGPVVAGAVILPKDCEILYLNDSKQLTAKRREELYDEIQEKAVATGVGMVGPHRIDEINILQATYEAMCEAIGQLSVIPQVLLNDAVTIPQVVIPQVPIIKGDGKSVSIAAASIIAKVTRDRLMVEYDELMPEYGFASHKGYGSAAHIAAIQKYGPSPIHRSTFIKNFVNAV
ncbi:MAG: ribonuclease HII [Lachnospiraceae bacterium]|nr:ribonuclease HII [Lachnospiraceae bacterium]